MSSHLKRPVTVHRKLSAVEDNPDRFAPMLPADDFENYKITFVIFPDGKTVPTVRLLADGDSDREGIIAQHYIRFLAGKILRERIGIDYIKRDEPWDFRIQLNKNWSFNIEITAFANERMDYAVVKREQEIKALCKKDTVSIADLERVEKWLGEGAAGVDLEALKRSGKKTSDKIPNPLGPTESRLTLHRSDLPLTPFSERLERLIEKKEKKRHPDKENTVLIIDNQCLHTTRADLRELVINIPEVIKESSFPEIYFYTGYYGEQEGSHAAFSFIPLKVPKEFKDRLIATRLIEGVLNGSFDEFVFQDEPRSQS